MDVSKGPIVTVLMAVFNGEPFLPIAIESILNQTYSQFCFLIVDDSSTDNTREIIGSYNDDRIKLISLKTNGGQTAALNAGLAKVTTPWIARMDADDYSAPNRLQQQMAALESNPRLSCIGSCAWIFHDDPQKSEGIINKPISHVGILEDNLSAPPIIHGSLVVKRDLLLTVGSYDARYWFLADVDLFDRLLPYCESANLPEPLLGIRRHDKQASLTKRAANEGIEIATKRIATRKYSRKEISIIRTSLIRAYFYRSRCAFGDGDLIDGFKYMGKAFLTSPSKFIFYFVVVFGIYSIRPAIRSRIKNVLRQIKAPIKT